jgi:hypothetical protein
VPATDGESRQRAADAYAHAHLGPWTEWTQDTGVVESIGRLFIYRWANIRPDGAWTGDWWGVMVDTQERAIIGFFQQRASREVGLDEVKVTREQAIRLAMALYEGGAGTQGRKIEVAETKLIMSSRSSPGCGPAWVVSLLVAGTQPMTHIVDGTTGELLKP